MGKKVVRIAYEDPAAKKAEAKYMDAVRRALDLMGSEDSFRLIDDSFKYVKGAHQAGIDPKVVASTIWHQQAAFEDPKAARGYALYTQKVSSLLQKMGHSSFSVAPHHEYLIGAHRGGVSPETAAAVLWHKHCADRVVPPGAPCAAHECPAEPTGGVKTDLGYAVHATHPMASNGYKYRSRVISGWRHYEEYVAPVGEWVSLGKVLESAPAAIEAHDSSPLPACAPFTRVTKDRNAFAACMARAAQIGPLDDDRKMYEFLRTELESQDQEIFVVVGLDIHRNVRAYVEVARGQRSKVTVHAEDVLRPVILSGVHAFVIAHNHPSGDASPSKSDADLTETIRRAALVACPNVKFLDHLVVGESQYFSFTDGKLKK